MKKYLQKFIGIILAICVCCTGCSQQPMAYQKVDTAMGTIINQTIYSADRDVANAISKDIISCINELEQNYLSWRLETSEIYKINAGAGSGQKRKLSDLLINVFDQCQKVYTASDGAFDFSMGSVARLWDIDTWAVMSPQGTNETNAQKQSVTGDVAQQQATFLPPTDQQLTAALEHVGGNMIPIEGNYVNLPEGMQLDLGAVGKGIALDEVQKRLQQQEEVTGAVISIGGSILTYGSKPDGSNWNVGIVNPFDTSLSLGVLSFSGEGCISTSGDYERYVEVDGVRYHHILDPATGKPADSGVKSVTILYKDSGNSIQYNGLFSDALSTACFVLGVEEGLKLAEEFDAEALFVDEQGEIHMTEGMEQYFYLSNTGK